MHLSGALAGDLRALAQWEGGAPAVLIGRLWGGGGGLAASAAQVNPLRGPRHCASQFD